MCGTLEEAIQPVGQPIQQVLVQQDLWLGDVGRAGLRVGAVHPQEGTGLGIRGHRAQLPGHLHHALGTPVRFRMFGVVHTEVLPMPVQRNHRPDAIPRVDLHLP